MSAIDTLRDALFGNPPSPATKPSREGVFAAFAELAQLLTASGLASTIYDTTAVGISQTTTGQLFLVKGSGGSFADLYKNVSGTAVSQGLSLPSNAAVVELVARADAAATLIDELETDSLRHDDEIAAANTANAQNVVSPLDEAPGLTIGGAGFNGGTFDASTGQVTIPGDKTGALSFATGYIDLHREIDRSGEVVTLSELLTTSADFLQASAGNYVVRINAFVTVDGVRTEQPNEGTNLSITQTAPNEVRLTGDYVLKGGEIEQAGLSLQIGEATATTGVQRFFRHKKASYSFKSETANTSAVGRRDADFALTSGNILDMTTNEGQVFSDAVVINGGRGLSVPSGKTGALSYQRFLFDAGTISENIGSTMLFRMRLRTTTALTNQTQITGNLSVWHNGVPTYANAKAVATHKVSDNVFDVYATYRVIGDETTFGPYSQIAGGSAARTTDGDFTLERLDFAFTGHSFVGQSPLEQIVRWREQRIADETSSGEVRHSKTVEAGPDGSADYATMAAAIAAEGGGRNFATRILYNPHEKPYTEPNIYLPKFGDVIGVGQATKIQFRAELPDNVNPATIPTVQAFWMNDTGDLKNVSGYVRNARYVGHLDSGASSNRAVQVIEDCRFEHGGNDGARAYQVSIGHAQNDPASPYFVWNSEYPLGIGTHSGQHIYIRRTTLVGPTAALYFHTNADFDEPSYIEVENCTLDCPNNTGNAIIVQALGSGQPDRLVIKDTQVRGTMLYAPAPWLSQKLENQRGDRNSEIKSYASGCGDAIPFTSFNGANVLELRSIDAAASAVAVSGTGAVAMFGTQPDTVVGGVGYPARVRSQHAITGTIAGVSLGARLGDCTSTNKVLNILFDGSISKTITLNQNYTSLSNAQVVAALNTALADGTRVFQELDPYADTNHLHQPEWESKMLNTGNTAIIRGMPVVYDGSEYQCRVATAADPLSAFAGFALQTFVAGQSGRVMIPGGRIHENQALFSAAQIEAWGLLDGNGDLVNPRMFGETFGISSTPGMLVEGTTTPLLRCVEVRNGVGIFRLLKAI